MLTILKKEIRQFFSSLIGYIAVVSFLLLLGLFTWVFPNTSILNHGTAALDGFFVVAPYVFMFLIPAITMRSFAEEISTGTIELLNTRPVTDFQVIMGKYLAAVVLVFISIIPTFIYVIAIYFLAEPTGNIDMGGIMGSYFGLFFLGAVFVAIGIFASSITGEQIVAFLVGLFLCFIIYWAFDEVAGMDALVGKYDYLVQNLGLVAHYDSIGKGVVDTRDVVYFLSVISLFILFSRTALARRRW